VEQKRENIVPYGSTPRWGYAAAVPNKTLQRTGTSEPIINGAKYDAVTCAERWRYPYF